MGIFIRLASSCSSLVNVWISISEIKKHKKSMNNLLFPFKGLDVDLLYLEKSGNVRNTIDQYKNSKTDLLVPEFLHCLIPSPHFDSLPVPPPLSADSRNFHLKPLGTELMPKSKSRKWGELRWEEKHS